MRSMRIHRIINNGRNSLKKASLSDKEIKRFSEIYATVYRHARKKGQTHKAALSYCWNVYAGQAPEAEKRIIKNIMSHKMKLDKQDLRQMIIREMVEADVINMSDFKQKAIDPDPEVAPAAVFDAFISEMHNQIISFMEESFEELNVDQQGFLDEILDSIEDRLGMEEEAGFDVSSFEDEEDV
jgi:hypothetical protein